MTVLPQVVAPVTITSGTMIVFVVGNPIVLYGFMFIVSVTCIVWSVSIIRSCNKRQRRLEAIATRASRRAHAADTDPPR